MKNRPTRSCSLPMPAGWPAVEASIMGRPHERARVFGRRIGAVGWSLARGPRRLALDNLAHVFPEHEAAELERGDVQEVLVRGLNGYAVMVAAGGGTLLLAMTNAAAKLGLIFLDMRRAVGDIKKIL